MLTQNSVCPSEGNELAICVHRRLSQDDAPRAGLGHSGGAGLSGSRFLTGILLTTLVAVFPPMLLMQLLSVDTPRCPGRRAVQQNVPGQWVPVYLTAASAPDARHGVDIFTGGFALMQVGFAVQLLTFFGKHFLHSIIVQNPLHRDLLSMITP
ncbi:hypothetical protein TREES_T100016632 [Tupaia chinensis]|uniref:Uncharacterized protein n=1 Tax=Tupaia chinensis TaxID=246437 RepID=L9L6W8_TUPCH|nr:hypothetical protein TREES_T100016632 [Tupaia chinensis]